MVRIGSAPVPSLQFFRVYVGVLLDAKREVLHPASASDSSQVAPSNPQVSNQGVVAPDAASTQISAAGTGNGSARASAIGLANSPERATVAEMPPTLGRPQAIWNRLALLLDQQLMEASRMAGPLGLEFHREAVYVMAALTDETFLHLDWEGREFWLANLLEARFFQSHLAGEQFFRRIDQLLLRDDEPAGEVASVYLSAIALGFRGRYRAQFYQNTIDSYRKRLFFFVVRREPELAEGGLRLFPEAYENALEAGAAPRLPNPRRWLLLLAGAVLTWLVVAQFVWSSVSSELRHQLCCLTPDCTTGCVQSPASSK